MKKWILKELVKRKKKDLDSCTCKLEYDMCNAICNMEIKKVAKKITTKRKLTIGERKILQSL